MTKNYLVNQLKRNVTAVHDKNVMYLNIDAFIYIYQETVGNINEAHK